MLFSAEILQSITSFLIGGSGLYAEELQEDVVYKILVVEQGLVMAYDGLAEGACDGEIGLGAKIGEMGI